MTCTILPRHTCVGNEPFAEALRSQLYRIELVGSFVADRQIVPRVRRGTTVMVAHGVCVTVKSNARVQKLPGLSEC